MTPFRRLRQILRCLDVSLVNVLYDVLMFHYISVTRCSDGRHVTSKPSASSAMEAQEDWWYQQLKSNKPQNGPREIKTRVVGVTYENRQTVVAQLTVEEQLWLRREPDNPYDKNAICVERKDGQQVGYLARNYAATLAPQFDKYGEPVLAHVTAITGGHDNKANLGVQICFTVPGKTTL